MVCPFCGKKLQVSNSRHQKRTNSVWRRRKCHSCHSAITTVEALDYPTAIVYKDNSGAFVAFLRDKLLLDVFSCLKHREAAVSDATALTDTVLSRLVAQTQDPVIPREMVVQTVTEVLKRFDKSAAVQYVAYHPNRSRDQ
jgi:transcriptional repressor NrdR